MRKIPNICPACGEPLMVTELRCPKCETRVGGEFNFSRLMRLNAEQEEFLLTFLKCRGNIKDMEKELGISYPTVRNKLDELLLSLGFAERVDEEEVSSKRKQILELIDKGQIKVSEAIKMLGEIREK